jgi:hypothetical protein
MTFRDMDPDSPEYEAALAAAQAEEDKAEGNQEATGDPEDEDEGAAPDAESKEKPEPTKEAPAATDTKTAEPEKPPKPVGVASKDGSTVLPYSVVQSARSRAAAERDARVAAEARAADLEQKLADALAGKKSTRSTLPSKKPRWITPWWRNCTRP